MALFFKPPQTLSVIRFALKSLILLSVLSGFIAFSFYYMGVSFDTLLAHLGASFFTEAPLATPLLTGSTEFSSTDPVQRLFLPFSLVTLASYLLGSLPFGLILTKAAGQKDIRTIGSGNIGATNVLRTGNKTLAALTLALDALKGTACVLFFSSDFFLGASLTNGTFSSASSTFALQSFGHTPDSTLYLQTTLSLLAASSVLIGHLYPVWLSYKGGKGIATLAGVLLGLSFVSGIVAMSLWLITFWKTKISSLAAVASLILMPVAAFWIEGTSLGFWLLGVSCLLLCQHKDNIKRLISGKEGKIDAPTSTSL